MTEEQEKEANKFGSSIAESRWFNQEPELVLNRMVPFEAHWMCPLSECGGEMKYNGHTWPTGGVMGYHHSCDKCHFQAAIHSHKYPEIIYRPMYPSPSSANHR